MAKSILHTIERNMDSFSKGQRLIAQFILDHYDKAAFMTANKLGKAVQVSESTVVRFAALLGYDGYPSMQRALQEMLRGKLTLLQRVQVSDDALLGHDLVSSVLQRDIEMLRMAVEQTDTSVFDCVVGKLIGAKRLYIVGFRSSSFLAGYLYFYMRMMLDNAILVQEAAGVFDQIFRAETGDVVFAISFPRYSELAIKSIAYVKERGAFIIGLTDSEMSPVAHMADASLLVPSEMIAFVDSLTAPMSMINSIIVAVSRQKGTEISARFSELEQGWERFSVFGKVEDE